MLEELDEIHKVLKEGVRFTKKLQPRHQDYLERLKASRRRLYLHKKLTAEQMEELHRKADEALGHEDVREALNYAEKNRFSITNWGAGDKESEFEPPNEWRPFLVNTAWTDEPKHPLGRLQRLLFRRVFENLQGVYVFPALGQDNTFLERHRFISLAPHPDTPEVKEGVRITHINKKAHELKRADLWLAHQVLGASPDEQRVLVLKGLQGLLNEGQMKNFLETVQPGHIAAFGTAATGYVKKPAALPHLDEDLHRFLIGEGYADVTHEHFSQKELSRLERIHELLRNYFAWQTGHFPASQVRIYHRERGS